MKKSKNIVALMLLGCATLAGAQAQAPAGKAAVEVAQFDEGRCRREVREYVDTIQYLKRTAGASIGDRVAEGYLAPAEVERIAASRGPCAAAQALRAKGTPR
jgi:hypothetical protein